MALPRHEPFISSWTLRVPRGLAAREAVGSSSSAWAYPLILSPRPPFFPDLPMRKKQPCLGSLLSCNLSREPNQSTARAPSSYFYPKSALCFTVPALINRLPKSPGLVLGNPFYKKSRIHTLQASLRQARSGLGWCLSGHSFIKMYQFFIRHKPF